MALLDTKKNAGTANDDQRTAEGLRTSPPNTECQPSPPPEHAPPLLGMRSALGPAAPPQAKASVFGRTATEVQGKEVSRCCTCKASGAEVDGGSGFCLPPGHTCVTTSKGISVWQNDSRSARKSLPHQPRSFGVSFPPELDLSDLSCWLVHPASPTQVVTRFKRQYYVPD